METLITKIEQILNQFGTEETGNRLSQFAMISLKEIILNEIRNYKSKENNLSSKGSKEDNLCQDINILRNRE